MRKCLPVPVLASALYVAAYAGIAAGRRFAVRRLAEARQGEGAQG